MARRTRRTSSSTTNIDFRRDFEAQGGNMRMQWNIFKKAILAGLMAFCFAGTQAQAQKMPSYKFDPDWPKVPLPNKWWMMGVTGMYVDKDDHIWVLTRPKDINNTQSFAALNPPSAECCV